MPVWCNRANSDLEDAAKSKHRLAICGAVLFGKGAAEVVAPSSKFQVFNPKAVRAARHREAGTTIAFIPRGTGTLLVYVSEREALAEPAGAATKSPAPWRG